MFSKRIPLVVYFSLLMAFSAFCPSCSSDKDLDNPTVESKIPENISGKVLRLHETKAPDSKISLCANHIGETGVVLEDRNDIDYGEYSPSYSYKANGSKIAEYTLEMTKKIYMNYTHSNYYSKWIINVELDFNSKFKDGYYKGTATSINTSESQEIEGYFSLLSPEESEDNLNHSSSGIIFTAPEISGITSSSAIISGTISGEVEYKSRGICWSTNSTKSGRYPFTKSGDIRSLGQMMAQS